jgi:hypothetical protein
MNDGNIQNIQGTHETKASTLTDVGHEHAAAAVTTQAQRIQSVTAHQTNGDHPLDVRCPDYQMNVAIGVVSSASLAGMQCGTHPSVYSACSRSRYVSHLLPITLPHVKQRTGMIIAAAQAG